MNITLESPIAHETSHAIEHHLDVADRVAAKIWRRCRGKHDLEDLKADAWFFLVVAQRKFDPARGVPFRAWCYWKVYRLMLSALRNMAFMSKHDWAQVQRGEREAVIFYSLDAPPPSGQGSTLGSTIAARESPDRSGLMDQVEAFLQQLSPLDARILRLRYLEGLHLAAIAELVGLPAGKVAERIHQVRFRFGAVPACGCRTRSKC